MKVAPREISPSGGQNRWPVALPLGDRLVVVYSRQTPSGYDLFSRLLAAKLDPLGDPEVLTSALGDEAAASLAFGPKGDVGVLFDGQVQVSGGTIKEASFFARLRCAAGP